MLNLDSLFRGAKDLICYSNHSRCVCIMVIQIKQWVYNRGELLRAQHNYNKGDKGPICELATRASGESLRGRTRESSKSEAYGESSGRARGQGL